MSHSWNEADVTSLDLQEWNGHSVVIAYSSGSPWRDTYDYTLISAVRRLVIVVLLYKRESVWKECALPDYYP